MKKIKEIGLYIHIPFCVQKCYYCDFCSFSDQQNKFNEYIDALIKEIEHEELENVIIKTLYIGGGTPSILEENLINKVLYALKSKFHFSEECEITIEVNPGTANKEKLKKYKSYGINRLSIGLQSTNNNILKNIGRIHNYKQFEDCYNDARECGFDNINIDLMIGLPNQTLKDIEESMELVLEINPEHISVYSLILEDETKMKLMIDSGKMNLPNENIERCMYWKVKNKLEQNGYIQYEISNFAKPNYQSIHNTDCWKQKEYIGFGLSAHSYYNSTRYSNTNDLDTYITNINTNKFNQNREIHEIQSINDKMNEYMILGLRMNEGINTDDFYKKFRKEVIKIYRNKLIKLEQLGLIIIKDEIIKLSNKGIDFANIVWQEFI